MLINQEGLNYPPKKNDKIKVQKILKELRCAFSESRTEVSSTSSWGQWSYLIIFTIGRCSLSNEQIKSPVLLSDTTMETEVAVYQANEVGKKENLTLFFFFFWEIFILFYLFKLNPYFFSSYGVV